MEDVSGNASTQAVAFTKQALDGSGFYGYDGNGNLTNHVVWDSGSAVTNAYFYDMENRLTKTTSNGVTVLECWYDGIGRRIAKRGILGGATNAVQYVWEGWSIMAVLDETGALLESYTRGVGVAYDVGSLVAVRHHSGTHSGSTFYLHNNHRGDVSSVRLGTSTVATYEYGAYGEIADSSGAYESRFGFSSKEKDAAMGFLYFGFRYYMPEAGRWPSRDPIAERGGVNLYLFLGNSVTRLVDYLGRHPLAVHQSSETYPSQTTMSPGDFATLYSKKEPTPGTPEHPGGGQCPNNPPKSNGCGPEGWKGKLIPDMPLWMVDFGPACDGHDKCFGTCGSVKAKCDEEFSGDLHLACFMEFGWMSIEPMPPGLAVKMETCIALAKAYHAAVVAAGNPHYEKGQEEACKCKCPPKVP